jgi:thymidylate synthase (FAD)
MKVTLISYTQDAEDLLIFTKRTRLKMSPDGLETVRAMSQEEKMAELDYMANTIPSSWEFVDYTFMVEGVSRAYTHQQVRTRAASYAQQSMRITDMSGFDFVMPERLKNTYAGEVVERHNLETKGVYEDLIEMAVPAEDARSILPTNIATNIVVKMNLRTFSELVKSRTGGRTQGEYQAVVSAMADEVLRVHPWAEKFFFKDGRDYFAEIEAFAEEQFGGDLVTKGKLLKIVDQMRKG